MAKAREHVRHILVSFGGGDARGALRKYLPELLQTFPEIKFHIIVRGNNRDIELLKETVAPSKMPNYISIVIVWRKSCCSVI